MSKLFADRAFVSVNGFELLELENLDFTINPNLTRVETMTRNRQSAGFRFGNKAISLVLTLAVERDKAQINLGLADPAKTVTIGMEMGGDKFTFTGIKQGELSGTASVGNATKTLNLEALNVIDEKGNSRLSDLSL